MIIIQIILIIIGIVGMSFIFAVLYGAFLYSITKELNEKEKEEYYDDVSRRAFHSMDENPFGRDWFDPF